MGSPAESQSSAEPTAPSEVVPPSDAQGWSSLQDTKSSVEDAKSTSIDTPEEQEQPGDTPSDNQKETPGNNGPGLTTNIEHAKLGKKLSRVVNILEEEIEDLLEHTSTGVSAAVERQMETLRSIGKQLKQEVAVGPDEDSDDEEEFVCEIKKLTVDDWQKGYDDTELPKPVLKVYYRSVPAATEGGEHGRPATSNKERPYRVIINAVTLLDELEEVSEMILDSFPAMLAAPYKLLVKYYPQMKDRLVQLKSQLAEMRNEIIKPKVTDDNSTNDNAGHAPIQNDSLQSNNGVILEDGHLQEDNLQSMEAGCSSDMLTHQINASQNSSSKKKLSKQPQTENEEAKRQKEQQHLATRISYLQLLHDFVKSDLLYYLELQAKVEDGSLEVIAFEDLWYLFKPGDIIFTRENSHERLYRVYSTTGGQQRRRNPTPDERESRRFQQRLPSSMNDSDNEPDEKPNLVDINVSGVGAWTSFKIDCYFMEFDGLLVGPVDSRKQINHYSGEFRIADLPIYPLRFHKNKDEISAKLEDRGRKLTSSYGHKSYNGPTIPETQRGHQEDISGDIFIDLKYYYQAYPHKKPKLGILNPTATDPCETEESVMGGIRETQSRYLLDHEVDNKARDNFMISQEAAIEPMRLDFMKDSAMYLQLLSYQVPAYVFRNRRYVQIDIEIAAEIDKSDEVRDDGFEDLVIPENHRNLLIALVQNHLASRKAESESDSPNKVASTQIDIVRGKGRGLIILLHGPPGSGKTSTAETLAAFTQRPLYSITCGDLGTKPSEVESNLDLHSTRAHKWDCVLLLDEADVFLTRRDWRDTERNALVSVFLRQLEYYSGILFLTTNRIGVLDEAFKSRIHLSLRYPSIGLAETKQIWENILNRITRNNKMAEIQIKFDRTALLSFAENHYRKNEETKTTWNGRQIRNAFQLAIALGRHDRDKQLKAVGLTSEGANNSGLKKWMIVKLSAANFRSIAKTAREFEDYLVDLRGPDSDTAYEAMLRYDSYGGATVAGKDYEGARSQRESPLDLTPSHNRRLPQRPMGNPPESRKASRVPAAAKQDEEEDEEDIFEDLSDG